MRDGEKVSLRRFPADQKTASAWKNKCGLGILWDDRPSKRPLKLAL